MWHWSDIRERTIAGLEAARARGRPTVMGPERIAAARALLAQPGATVTGVARDLGVSRNTLYRQVITPADDVWRTTPPSDPSERIEP